MATSKFEIESSSDNIEKWCDLCKLSDVKTFATVYCRTCKQFQCDSCTSIHQVPTLAKHSIVDVEDNAAGKGEFDMQNLDRCQKHDKRFKFFCKVDNELCCSTCAISSHIHKCGGVSEIDSFIDTNDDEMREMKTKIQNQTSTSSKLTTSGTNIKTLLRKDQADKLQKIEHTKDKVIQMFDTLKAEFMAKTDTAISNIELAIDNDKTSRTETDEQRYTMDSFLDNVASEGSPRQIFSTLNIYNKRLGQFEKQLKQSCDMLVTLNIDFSFNELLVKVLDTTESIGEITIQKIKHYEPLELHQAVSMDLQPSDEDAEPLFSGLDFMSNGKLVAVDNTNHTCVIMNETLSVLGVKNKVETNPLDVTAMSGNKVAVSSGANKLSMYTMNQDNTLKKLNTIKTISQLDSLCTLDDKTLIASTFNTEGPTKKVTIAGEETDFDLPWRISRYGMDKSSTTYIPSLDMLVLTDRDAHKCYLWNVKQRTKIVVEDGRIREPRGVCATSSGIIFVCSKNTNSIVQISPTGKFLRSTPLSMKFPYSISVSHDDKRLLVSNSARGATKLQLFNIN